MLQRTRGHPLGRKETEQNKTATPGHALLRSCISMRYNVGHTYHPVWCTSAWAPPPRPACLAHASPQPPQLPPRQHLPPSLLSQDYAYPEGEKPPLLVKIHGGPTSQASTALQLSIQYWTSQGSSDFFLSFFHLPFPSYCFMPACTALKLSNQYQTDVVGVSRPPPLPPCCRVQCSLACVLGETKQAAAAVHFICHCPLLLSLCGCRDHGVGPSSKPCTAVLLA